MADENRPNEIDPVVNRTEEPGSPLGWAWGRSFVIGAMSIIVVYQILVAWLASDAWRIVFAPLCIIPVYGLAHWINARKRKAERGTSNRLGSNEESIL